MIINKSIYILMFAILLLSPAFFVSAQADKLGAGKITGDKVGAGKTCTGSDSSNELCNPLFESGVNSPQTLIGKVIVAVLGIVGSLALLMFIYGGFTWMTAAGNEQAVTKGKDILIWATIGLIIIFSSYAMVKFVFEGVGAPVT